MSTRGRGFAYLEALVAAMLIAVALVPASDAVRSALQQAEISKIQVRQHYRGLETFERAKAQPFSVLNSEASSTGGTSPSTALSDAAGTDFRRLAYIARHDIDNADADDDPTTGTDNGYFRVRVLVDGTGIAFDGVVKAR